MTEPGPPPTVVVVDTSQPSPLSRLPLWVKVLIPAVALVLIVVIVIAVLVNGQNGKLAGAYEACDLGRSDYALLGDSGRTLQLDGAGAEDDGLTLSQMVCALNELNVSDAVIAAMDSTRALDGRVTGSWDNIDAVWSYHPDNGLDIILTLK